MIYRTKKTIQHQNKTFQKGALISLTDAEAAELEGFILEVESAHKITQNLENKLWQA